MASVVVAHWTAHCEIQCREVSNETASQVEDTSSKSVGKFFVLRPQSSSEHELTDPLPSLCCLAPVFEVHVCAETKHVLCWCWCGAAGVFSFLPRLRRKFCRAVQADFLPGFLCWFPDPFCDSSDIVGVFEGSHIRQRIMKCPPPQVACLLAVAGFSRMRARQFEARSGTPGYICFRMQFRIERLQWESEHSVIITCTTRHYTVIDEPGHRDCFKVHGLARRWRTLLSCRFQPLETSHTRVSIKS